MDDKELENLLRELRGEKHSVRERLTGYLHTEEAQAVPEKPEQPAFPEETEISEEPELSAAESAGEDMPAPEHPDIPDECADTESAKPTVRETMHRLLTAEPAREPDTDSRRTQRMRTRDALVGLFLTVFAVIGVIAVLRRVILLTGNLRKANSQETAVMERLLPLVLMDIPDFQSPDELSDEAFLTAAIWESVTADRLAAYPENYGMCTVPAGEIIAAGNALFGSTRAPVCKTIGFTGDLRFYYDAEQNAYVLPQEPVLFTYEPVLTALTEAADGSFQATVEYFAEQPHWKHTAQTEPVKTVAFTVAKVGTIWQVRAAHLESEE